jgi:transposase
MLNPNLKVLLAIEPIDVRKSFDGLARTVQERFALDPKVEQTVFVFVNRKCDIAKLLWRDRTGWCVLAKRLDEHIVVLPKVTEGTASAPLTTRALAELLHGVVRVRKQTGRDLAREARDASSNAVV